jgi:hypothetical protein
MVAEERAIRENKSRLRDNFASPVIRYDLPTRTHLLYRTISVDACNFDSLGVTGTENLLIQGDLLLAVISHLICPQFRAQTIMAHVSFLPYT